MQGKNNSRYLFHNNANIINTNCTLGNGQYSEIHVCVFTLIKMQKKST